MFWLIDWLIVSHDLANKQKQYNEPSRNKETNYQLSMKIRISENTMEK